MELFHLILAKNPILSWFQLELILLKVLNQLVQIILQCEFHIHKSGSTGCLT